MKKVLSLLLLVLFFGAITSCDPQSLSDENKEEPQLIEPGDSGGGTPPPPPPCPGGNCD